MGRKAACLALGVSRATLYRRRKKRQRLPCPPPAWTFSAAERTMILETLHQERFMDLSTPEIHAILWDEGIWLCSLRTMQRLLAGMGELRERRALRRHPIYQKPELLAQGPNQVWSWDITKVRGPQRGVWYYLYVVMDIFSRAVVGWTFSTREREHLAARLLEEAYIRQNILPSQLTVHADRGPSMRSQTVAELLERLEVRKSHNRPYVSNDNPYSESQFKTLKYHPTYPDRFGSIEDGIRWFREFFHWYNEDHHHHGIAMFTPMQVHTGQWVAVHQRRQAVLDASYAAHPERFSRPPQAKRPPETAWICKPSEPKEGQADTSL